MRSKLITIFALVLCMGAFLLPVTAQAATETTPPTVTAKISDNILRIEAADSDSGVEAVFINDKRVNYRVDGTLELDAKAVAGDGEKISIYAVDFAGNRSAVVEIDNPYYKPAETPEPTESAVPAEQRPFTPAGQASVVDEATDSDGKDFYSFTTPEGNVFYLVIDHQRNSENVYFLNAVNEDDLMALAEKSDKKGESSVPTPPPATTPEPTEKPAETPPPKEEGGNSGMIIFVVLALAAAGGAGYYFKILRPKQQAANIPDDDEPDDEYGEDEDYEDEEDTDEPEEAEDEIGGDDEDSATKDE